MLLLSQISKSLSYVFVLINMGLMKKLRGHGAEKDFKKLVK